MGNSSGLRELKERILIRHYQCDADMQPLPIIRAVLEVFGPDMDPWTLVA